MSMYFYSSACDAYRLLPVMSVFGEKFDPWKTGWSTIVQIPKDVQPNTVPKLVVTGNVAPYGRVKCASTFPAEREDDGVDDGRS